MYSWGPLCPTDMCPSAKTEVASSDFAALEWPLKRKSGKWHKSIPRAASTPTAPFPVVACRKCCIARALLREARDYTDQPHLKEQILQRFQLRTEGATIFNSFWDFIKSRSAANRP